MLRCSGIVFLQHPANFRQLFHEEIRPLRGGAGSIEVFVSGFGEETVAHVLGLAS